MLTEHEWIHERIRLCTMMKEHPDWGGRRLAHALGHDPKWVAKWKSRLLKASKLTLEVFRSASRTPQHIWHRTTPEAKAVVAELRTTLSERFHRPAGARTIQYGLREYLKQHPEDGRLSDSAQLPALHCAIPIRQHHQCHPTDLCQHGCKYRLRST